VDGCNSRAPDSFRRWDDLRVLDAASGPTQTMWVGYVDTEPPRHVNVQLDGGSQYLWAYVICGNPTVLLLANKGHRCKQMKVSDRHSFTDLREAQAFRNPVDQPTSTSRL